jgi:hypothetical protein
MSHSFSHSQDVWPLVSSWCRGSFDFSTTGPPVAGSRQQLQKERNDEASSFEQVVLGFCGRSSRGHLGCGPSFAAKTGLAGYVSAGEAEAYKKELAALRIQTAEEIRAALARAADEANHFRADYAAKLVFDYAFDAKAAREPFLVSAIYHDDRFTYIRSAAREKPALYETKDGKPNLIPFQLENGVYIAPKIIDVGYLAVGKRKFTFTRRVAAN